MDSMSIRERARLARLQAISAEEQAEAEQLAAKRYAARSRAARILSTWLQRMGIVDAPIAPEAVALAHDTPSGLASQDYGYRVEDLAFYPHYEDGSGGVLVAASCARCGELWGQQRGESVATLADLDRALEHRPAYCGPCNNAVMRERQAAAAAALDQELAATEEQRYAD